MDQQQQNITLYSFWLVWFKTMRRMSQVFHGRTIFPLFRLVICSGSCDPFFFLFYWCCPTTLRKMSHRLWDNIIKGVVAECKVHGDATDEIITLYKGNAFFFNMSLFTMETFLESVLDTSSVMPLFLWIAVLPNYLGSINSAWFLPTSASFVCTLHALCCLYKRSLRISTRFKSSDETKMQEYWRKQKR